MNTLAELFNIKKDVEQIKKSGGNPELDIKPLADNEVFVKFDSIKKETVSEQETNVFYYGINLKENKVKETLKQSSIEENPELYDNIKVFDNNIEISKSETSKLDVAVYDKSLMDVYLWNKDPSNVIIILPLHYAAISTIKNNKGSKTYSKGGYDPKDVVKYFWPDQRNPDTLTTVELYQEIESLIEFYCANNTSGITKDNLRNHDKFPEDMPDEEDLPRSYQYETTPIKVDSFDENKKKYVIKKTLQNVYNFTNGVVRQNDPGNKYATLNEGLWYLCAEILQYAYDEYYINRHFKSIIEIADKNPNAFIMMYNNYTTSTSDTFKHYIYKCDTRLYNAYIKYLPQELNKEQTNCSLITRDSISQLTIDVPDKNKINEIMFDLKLLSMRIPSWRLYSPVPEPQTFYVIFRVKQ